MLGVGVVGVRLDGDREGVADEFASLGERELSAGGQNGAVGCSGSSVTQGGCIDYRLFKDQAFRIGNRWSALASLPLESELHRKYHTHFSVPKSTNGAPFSKNSPIFFGVAAFSLFG